MKRYFQGTAAIMTLSMRQNRVFTLAWLLLPGLWVAINTLSSLVLFPTQEALAEMGVTLIDPLTVAIHGPLLDVSVAGFVTWRTKVFLVLASGIFSMIYVVRHTRLAEEQGKRELLEANVTGSLAALAAALLNMLLINAAAALLALLGMTALGLGFTGSLAHCLGFLAAASALGLMAGLVAQFFVGASAARGTSFGCLGLLFALHILWNVSGGNHPAAYLNPLEWPLLIRPFAGERFSVLLISLIIMILPAALSLWMTHKRDVGAGLIPQREGRAFAKPGFCSLPALAWRTQKGLFLSWLIFYAVFSFALGCASYLMVSAVSSAKTLAELIARLGGVDRAFMSLMLYIVSMLISVYVLMSAGILRREETAKGELLLSLPVRRSRFAFGHLVYIFGGSAALALVSGLCAGLGAMIGTGDQSALVRLFFEMAGKIPAIWAFGGISMLLFGVLPHWMSGLSYGLMVLFVLLEILWEQQSVSDAVYALSPFSWVTPLKVAQPPSVLVLLCALSMLSAVLGIVLFERRDAAMH
ncbi:putative ABC transporter [Desulfitobacterium hafniense DCB-2]|uniref:Putative ABC transporter n=1 Tax=Desulfitobacterium hafniense (strain DSM 10664 / DCB-2) TaxID=272564 RepID=B8G2G5_DESHD|nr:ABC transporter [Desulfitobacterium hafniense]ACL21315.1 putative ABC transporter [Desulfitobacterium hafniense DCB-2]